MLTYNYFHNLLHKLVWWVAHRERRRCIVSQHHFAFHIRQVEEDFDPASEQQQVLLDCDWVPEEVGVPPENLEVQLAVAVLEVNVQEPALAAVQQHQSVDFGSEGDLGPDLAVDSERVAEELRHPVLEVGGVGLVGVEQLAILSEGLVDDGEVLPLDVAVDFEDVALF